MTTEKRDAIITKIMKLMALGNEDRNDNANERENANRQVKRLMAEYSIDFVDLREGKQPGDTFVRMTVDGSEDTLVDYEATLANSIANAFDCKVINSYNHEFGSDRPYNAWQLIFVGTKNDLDISVFFFNHLRRTIHSLARKNITAETVRPTPNRNGKMVVDIKNARRNYCYGLVITIGDRLEDLYRGREEFIPSNCTALMVVKKQGLEKAFDDFFPTRTSSRRAKGFAGDQSAFYKGKDDGHKVNLSRPIGNNNSSAPAGQIS